MEELLRGGTIPLEVYLEDSNNDPVLLKTLSEVKIDVNYSDGTTPSANNSATRELGDGWYAYDYTDTNGKKFIYICRDSAGTHKNFPGGKVVIKDIVDTSDTNTHTNVTTEQTVFEETISSGIKILRDIRLDLYNLVQNATVRVHEKVDGTNYREIDRLEWDSTMSKGVPIATIYASKDIKVTIQSTPTAQGESKNVPYRYKLETL